MKGFLFLSLCLAMLAGVAGCKQLGCDKADSAKAPASK